MHLRQGETVAAEGDTVKCCFMIEYGSVEVCFAQNHCSPASWLGVAVLRLLYIGPNGMYIGPERRVHWSCTAHRYNMLQSASVNYSLAPRATVLHVVRV